MCTVNRALLGVIAKARRGPFCQHGSRWLVGYKGDEAVDASLLVRLSSRMGTVRYLSLTKPITRPSFPSPCCANFEWEMYYEVCEVVDTHYGYL